MEYPSFRAAISPHTIRNLIWDMDGTLFDTYPAMVRAFAAALADFAKYAPADRIERLARQELATCASVLAGELDLGAEELLRRFGRHYRDISPEEQSPFPGVIEVCTAVRAVGGMNVIVTHRRRESTIQFLEIHAMTGYFADLIAKEDGYPRKPDPAAFEAMIDRHGFKRAETLAVGDRDIDILAGQAAGVRACLFGPVRGEAVPDLVIREYADLAALIVAENGG